MDNILDNAIKIGEGTYGTVWYDKSSLFVYKVINKIDKLNKNEIEIATFKEITALQYLNHPNIIKLYNIINNKDTIILELEYGGISLSKWIESSSYPERIKSLKWIVYQILHVLAYLEQNNIIHGDLKPSNILINPDNLNIKIIDWGTTSFPNSVNTWCSCTYVFAPPEILICDNIEYSNKVDIYSLGMLIRNIIYKKYDDEEEYKKILKNEFNKGIEKFISFEQNIDTIDIDQEFINLCQDMLIYDKSKRPGAVDLLQMNTFKSFHSILENKRKSIMKKTNEKLSVSYKMRKILLKWLYKACSHLNSINIFPLTAWIHDQFFQKFKDITINDYQMYGIACLAISNSIINDIPIKLTSLCELAENCFSLEELNISIWVILQTLDYVCYKPLFDIILSEKCYNIDWDIVKEIIINIEYINLSEMQKTNLYLLYLNELNT